MKYIFPPFLFFVFLLLPFPAAAQLLDVTTEEHTDEFEEGTDYELLAVPQPVRDPGRVEVIEFFWYGCPSCYRLEPVLRSWVNRQPEDVLFREFPAVWNPTLEVHAQAYFTARALDVLERLHFDLFVRLVRESEPLNNQAQIRRFFALHEVVPKDFDRAWSSFGVKSAVRQAAARMRRYGVRGTPVLVVQGKYLVPSARNTERMFQVVDYLVERERFTLLPSNVRDKTSSAAPADEAGKEAQTSVPGDGEKSVPAAAVPAEEKSAPAAAASRAP